MEIEKRPHRLLRILVAIFVIVPIHVVLGLLQAASAIVAFMVVGILSGWDSGITFTSRLEDITNRWRL